jgi:hypothetical protein
MRVKRLIAFILPLLAAILAISGYLFAAHKGQPHSVQTLLAFSIATSVIYIGCAILFLLGLKNFTAQLKRAYGVFCAGLIIFALSELQIPILASLGQYGSNAWLAGAGALVPILLGVGSIYAGIRLFAGLFHIKSLWGRPWFVVLAGVVGAVAAYMLPVGASISTAQESKGSNGLMGMMLMLFLATAILCYHIQKKASVSYKAAMLWFEAAQLGFVVIAAVTIGSIVIAGSKGGFVADGYTLLVQAIFALFTIKAAYEFNTIGQAPQPEVNSSVPGVALPSRASTIDIIIATAQKASDSTAIDPLLDGMRRVTSGHVPGQALSPQDEATLMRTYQQLEHYLTQEDPVRRYSAAELRTLISKELNLGSPSFFDKLQ